MPQRVAIRQATTSHGASPQGVSDAAGFSDATCERLTSIVLASASVDSHRETPEHLLEEFQIAVDSDRALRVWDQEASHGTDVAKCPVATLAHRLVRFPTWVARPSHGASPDVSNAARRLLDTAGLAIRLQALEANFASELAAQKQQAIYNFAYGLSHELNNPLANIATRAGVLASDETDAQRVSLLNVIVDNAMRGSEMLGDLMLVARPPALHLQSTAIADLVSAIVSKAEAWASPRGVKVELRNGYTGCVDLDAVAMSEAMWALIRNGIQAMLQGGLLTVTTSHERTDSREFCVLEICDEGQGLSAKALNNCFDPYFSGREAGRGLGLGLSKAQRIVKLHGGELSLANRPGGGCKARIELPS